MGGYHFDRTRQIAGSGAVEKHPSAQTHVGQQVAVTLGLVGQHSGEVLADHQPTHTDIATEIVVGHRDHPGVVSPARRHERGQNGCAEGAGQHPNRCTTTWRQRYRRGFHDRPGTAHGFGGRPRSWGSIAIGGSAVDPGEEAGAGAIGPGAGIVEFGFEGARHADAVLVHREILVDRRGRECSSGQKVVLVCREHDPSADRRKEHLLPLVDQVNHSFGFGPGVGTHTRLGVELRHPEGNDADGCELREAFEHAGERAVQHVAVVEAGTHDDLAVHLDVGIEQCP